MKIALVVISGSRGDVQPFVCLGRALADAGEEVEVVAPLNGEGMARAAGLAFRPFPIDAQELLADESAQRMLGERASGPVLPLGRERRTTLLGANRRVLIEVGREADLLVCGIFTWPAAKRSLRQPESRWCRCTCVRSRRRASTCRRC